MRNYETDDNREHTTMNIIIDKTQKMTGSVHIINSFKQPIEGDQKPGKQKSCLCDVETEQKLR